MGLRPPTYPTLIHVKNSGKVQKIPQEIENKYMGDILQVGLYDDDGLDIMSIGQKMHFKPDEQNNWSTQTRSEGRYWIAA